MVEQVLGHMKTILVIVLGIVLFKVTIWAISIILMTHRHRKLRDFVEAS